MVAVGLLKEKKEEKGMWWVSGIKTHRAAADITSGRAIFENPRCNYCVRPYFSGPTGLSFGVDLHPMVNLVNSR